MLFRKKNQCSVLYYEKTKLWLWFVWIFFVTYVGYTYPFNKLWSSSLYSKPILLFSLWNSILFTNFLWIPLKIWYFFLQTSQLCSHKLFTGSWEHSLHFHWIFTEFTFHPNFNKSSLSFYFSHPSIFRWLILHPYISGKLSFKLDSTHHNSHFFIEKWCIQWIMR